MSFGSITLPTTRSFSGSLAEIKISLGPDVMHRSEKIRSVKCDLQRPSLYCADFKCSHSVVIRSSLWPDHAITSGCQIWNPSLPASLRPTRSQCATAFQSRIHGYRLTLFSRGCRHCIASDERLGISKTQFRTGRLGTVYFEPGGVMEMPYLTEARLGDVTLSATIEPPEEAFAKAIEWQVVERFSGVTKP